MGLEPSAGGSVDERVTDIIVESFQVDRDSIGPDMSFQRDLGADSLQIVELVMAFEEEFDLEIPEEDTEKIETIADAIAYLKERLGA